MFLFVLRNYLICDFADLEVEVDMDFVGSGPGEFDDNVLEGDGGVGFVLNFEWVGNHLVEEHFAEAFFHVFFDIGLDDGDVFFG